MITKRRPNNTENRDLVVDWWSIKVRLDQAMNYEEKIAYAKLLGILSSAVENGGIDA